MMTIPPASIATSVPLPMAIPRSACASAGASLIPSPTIATTLPVSWIRRTFAALSSGKTSARILVMPTWLAIARAVRSLSPVIIHVSIPRACSASTASLEVTLTVSATAMTPITTSLVASSMAVLPDPSRRSIFFSRRSSTRPSFSTINRRLPK